MKKRLNLILLCLLTIVLFCFVGCGGSDNINEVPDVDQGTASDEDNGSLDENNNGEDSIEEDNDNQPDDKPTAYELLSYNEKLFFDSFKSKISLFKNPSSVKIINIVGSYYNQSYFDFSISAQNSFGATISEGYILFTKLWTAPDSTEIKYGNYGNTALAGTMISYSEFSDGTFFSAYAKLAIIDPDAEYCDSFVYSVSKINNAIKEYQIDNGWL